MLALQGNGGDTVLAVGVHEELRDGLLVSLQRGKELALPGGLAAPEP